jgi:hypothetical protein
MSTTETEEYVKPRNAFAWQAHALRSPTVRYSYMLPSTGGSWPKKRQSGARPRSGLNLTSPALRAIAQELEARGGRTPAGRDRWAAAQVTWDSR